jgi:uncharacterized membrane protein
MIVKKVYRIVVQPILVSSLLILAVGIMLSSSNVAMGPEILKLGLWMLISMPMIPILTLLYEYAIKKDLYIILVIAIILAIILANVYYYGFNHLPFS